MVRRKLTEVLEEYRQKKKRLRWNTIDSYSRAWNKLIDFTGDIMVSDFDNAEDFEAYLFEQALAAGAVKSNMKMVKVIMRWAWQKDYRQGDPFSGLRLPRVPGKEIRVFTDAELYGMLAAAPNDMWAARIIAAGSAGLRRSESLNLKVSDVDFDKGIIKIQSCKDTKETWPYSPKDYESRRLPLTEELNRLFVRILDELPVGYPYLMITAKRYWWLQQLRSQGKMGPRMMINPDENFCKPFGKILRTAKISDGTYRDLRSTAITRWLLAGLAPQEAQRLAGHSDIETTMTFYAACRADIIDRARQAWSIGATGLEPATS